MTNKTMEVASGNQPHISKVEHDRIIAAMNPDKIIAENKPKTEEAIMESLSNERASREPLPGPAEFIFNNDPLTVKTSIGEVVIRPMKAYDINIFKLINSPFYRVIMNDIENGQSSMFTTEEESYELIYQFTHPCKDVYQLFKRGPEVFRDVVIEEVAFVYNPQDAALLVEKIMSHIFQVNMARTNFDVAAQETSGGETLDKKKLMSAVDTTTTSSTVSPVVLDGCLK